MTGAAKKVLEEFDTLSEGERAQVALEILRRIALSEHDLPGETELAALGDELFLQLDRDENRE